MHHKKHIRLLLSLMGCAMLHFTSNAMKQHRKIRLLDTDGKEIAVVNNLDPEMCINLLPFCFPLSLFEFTMNTAPEGHSTFFADAPDWQRSINGISGNLDSLRLWVAEGICQQQGAAASARLCPDWAYNLIAKKLRMFMRTSEDRTFKLDREINIATPQARLEASNGPECMLMAVQTNSLDAAFERLMCMFELVRNDPRQTTMLLKSIVECILCIHHENRPEDARRKKKIEYLSDRLDAKYRAQFLTHVIAYLDEYGSVYPYDFKLFVFGLCNPSES